MIVTEPISVVSLASLHTTSYCVARSIAASWIVIEFSAVDITVMLPDSVGRIPLCSDDVSQLP